MTWKQFFTSSIGKKFIMGFTGFFLIAFLIIHCLINGLIFFNDGGETFNFWAHFMGSNLIMRLLEVGLFAGILLHIIQGFIVWAQNTSARPVKYAVSDANSNSKWYSRSMGLLGTIIFLFLIVHLADFWVPSRFGGLHEVIYPSNPNQVYHNLYAKMVEIFQNPIIVVLYILGCISLAYHLAHGFQSAFRTMGVFNKRYNKMLTVFGNWFSVIVSFAFAMMPVSMYLGWVK